MSITGFRAQNHPQQTSKRGAKDAVDDRGTDPIEFAKFDAEFGPFTLDVAASAANAKCDQFFSIEDDGLAQDWHGRVWCNPPFSDCGAWVRKAHTEWKRSAEAAWDAGGPPSIETIVMLLPANRREQKWWQEMVEPSRDHHGSELSVRFLPGRMRFHRPDAVIGPKGDRPPFGCCLLIWGGHR